jgi:hypothetical protein
LVILSNNNNSKDGHYKDTKSKAIVVRESKKKQQVLHVRMHSSDRCGCGGLFPTAKKSLFAPQDEIHSTYASQQLQRVKTK